jgi:replicative DNA helicase Mcm
MSSTPLKSLPDGEARIVEYIQQQQMDMLEAVAKGETETFDINMKAVFEHDDYLYRYTIHNPGSRGEIWWKNTLTDWEDYCETTAQNDDYDAEEADHPDDWPGIPEAVNVTATNLPDEALIDIGAPRTDLLGQHVKVRGVVRHLSPPKTRVKQAVFECRRCATQHFLPVKNDSIQTPHECRGCDSQGPWRRMPTEEKRVDYQEMEIQEEPSKATDTSNPRVVRVRIEGTELTDSGLPGERVSVSGVLREELEDEDSVMIDSHLKAIEIEGESQDYESMEITADDVTKIEETSERDNLLELFGESLAPDIHGNELAKQAIVLQLMGGVTRHEEAPNQNTKGGEIHLAFIGDPGTSKSQLAKYARNVAPRSVKAVGKGATAAGMTASAVKKTIAGSTEWTLQAGSLVLADKGHITIDELDKMGEEVQHALHEALADREVSVNKADINDVTLKARTSALMIANPVYGRFDEYEKFTDQFGIESSLLDRAALVVIFADEADENEDAKIANTIIDSHWDTGESDDEDEKGLLDTDHMRKYIAHARREYSPTATRAVHEKLQEFYSEIRGMSGAEGAEKDVSIAPRALEGIIKFAEAHARLRLSDTVELQDADTAIELFMEAYNKAGLDDGGYSADRFTGREPAPRRKQQKQAIREVINNKHGGQAPIDDLIEDAASMLGDKGSVSDVEHVVDRMLEQGDLTSAAGGVMK